MKFQKSFYTFVNTAIRILLVLIVSGLLLQSLFSTSFIGVVTSEAGIGMERTRNIADDPWRHLLVFAVFTAVGILIRQIVRRRTSHPALQTQAYGQTGNAYANNDKLTENAGNNRIFCYLSLFTIALWTFWILITQLEPGSDPAKVYGIAMQWRGIFQPTRKAVICSGIRIRRALFCFIICFLLSLAWTIISVCSLSM